MSEAMPRKNLSTLSPNVQLMAEIGIVARQWRAAMDEQLRSLGVTQARWVTLWWIAESPTVLNQKDLAKRVGIESSTLVRQLDALEARGLIERVVDRDRRARLIKITPAALPVIDRIKQLADELGSEILTGVDPDAVIDGAGLLRVMRERLRDRTKSSPAADEDDRVTNGAREKRLEA
jgi:MarR family transcriptional regulator for hemolysin